MSECCTDCGADAIVDGLCLVCFEKENILPQWRARHADCAPD